MSRDSKFSINCYPYCFDSIYVRSVIAIPKHKTSFEVDPEKVAAAKEVLGTKTMTETVDAALDEIVKRRQREGLLELLDTPGAFALDDPEVMKGAWRAGGRSSS